MDVFFEGAVSVDFFFILSGFVIAYAYLDKVQNCDIDSLTFLRYRIYKLFPVHVLFWIAAVFLNERWGGHISLRDFFCGLFLMQSYIPQNYYVFIGNGVSWSVSTEFFFYVYFAVTVCGRRYSKEERMKSAMLLLLGVILMSFFYGGQIDIAPWLFYINPLFRLIDFLAGILLYEYGDRIWKRFPEIDGTIMEVVVCILFAAWVYVSIAFGIFKQAKFETFWYLLPCTMLVGVFSKEKGLLSRILSADLMQILGRSSYGFFLSHQIVLRVVRMLFLEQMTDLQWMLFFSFTGFIFSWILSIAVTEWVEEPINGYLRRKYR